MAEKPEGGPLNQAELAEERLRGAAIIEAYARADSAGLEALMPTAEDAAAIVPTLAAIAAALADTLMPGGTGALVAHMRSEATEIVAQRLEEHGG